MGKWSQEVEKENPRRKTGEKRWREKIEDGVEMEEGKCRRGDGEGEMEKGRWESLAGVK